MTTRESVRALHTAVADHWAVLLPAALLASAAALAALLAMTQGLQPLQASAHRSRWLALDLVQRVQQWAWAVVLPVRTDHWS